LNMAKNETAAGPAPTATPAPLAATTTPSPGPSATGRGGSGGRGNNNQNSRRGNPGGQEQQERPSSTPNQPRPARFEGWCDELKGHIYDCSDNRQTDGYTRTTNEIAEYIGRTYRHGADIRASIEHIDTPMQWNQPADPVQGATQTETKLWEL
jgi:hypothetical protein